MDKPTRPERLRYIVILRYRRVLITGRWRADRYRYRWDWTVPGTEHESGRYYLTRLGTRWSAYRFERNAGLADEVGVEEPAQGVGFRPGQAA